jgi:hypothetical protein
LRKYFRSGELLDSVIDRTVEKTLGWVWSEKVAWADQIEA